MARFKRVQPKHFLPGFAFTLSCTLLYLIVMIVVPMVMLLAHNLQIPWAKIVSIITASRVQNALLLTVLMALCAAAINGVMGLIVSWVLVRYRFFGSGFLDAIIDIPFAIPTAVAGIALATLFHKSSWLGHYLDVLGIQIAFTKAGIVVALVFVGLPFVIRMVQPVLQGLSHDNEEAALALGAGSWQVFWRVYFPQLLPSLISGMSLAFARALGEFGSVIFIAGNVPSQSEVISLVIFIKLEQHDLGAATVIASLMLLLSLTIMFAVHQWEYRLHRYYRREGA